MDYKILGIDSILRIKEVDTKTISAHLIHARRGADALIVGVPTEISIIDHAGLSTITIRMSNGSCVHCYTKDYDEKAIKALAQKICAEIPLSLEPFGRARITRAVTAENTVQYNLFLKEVE